MSKESSSRREAEVSQRLLFINQKVTYAKRTNCN